MKDEIREKFEKEQGRLVEKLSKLDPSSESYEDVSSNLDTISRILDRDESNKTNKRLDNLEEKFEEFENREEVEEDPKWWENQYIWRFGEKVFEGSLFVLALNWEKVNNWTSKVYGQVRNIFR